MKDSELIIKEIKATAVLAPLARPITTAHTAIPAAPLVLIDVLCSKDIIGRSYIFGYTPVSLTPLVKTIENLAEIWCGSPVAPETLRQEMDDRFRLLGRQGFLGMAMAGLDMAFWDALGKAQDISLAKLLGGSEAPIPCYDSFGVFNADSSPSEIEHSLKLGFKALKFKIGGTDVQADIKAVKAIRNIIGPDIALMVDYNQSLNPTEAIERIKRLAEFSLDWVEEPVPAEDFSGHAAVRKASEIPIQTGENWWFPEDAVRATEAQISDHVMLDIVKIGGVTGWLQAAKIVESAALPVSSHLFIEASAHVLAVTPNAHLLEYLDVASAILADPHPIKDGTLSPRGPGLGIDWDLKAIQNYAT